MLACQVALVVDGAIIHHSVIVPGASMTCGTCALCCKIKGIGELGKPAGRWCPHCNKAQGCTIYESRPQSCRDYECFWHRTQRSADPMPAYFRPDKTRVIIDQLSESSVVVACDVAEPFAWQRDPMRTFLTQKAQDRSVFVVSGKRVFKIFSSGEFDELPQDKIVRDGANVSFRQTTATQHKDAAR